MRRRLGSPRASLIPARADLDLDGRIKLFIGPGRGRPDDGAPASIATRDLPRAVLDYLRAAQSPLRLAMASDPLLARGDWASTMLEIWRTGRAEDRGRGRADHRLRRHRRDRHADAAARRPRRRPRSPSCPRPRSSCCSAERILRAYEDGFALLRAERGALPRSLNLITGPSRSGDIEQTLQLGAHGPRRLLRAAGRRAAERARGHTMSRPRRPTAEELALWRRAMGDAVRRRRRPRRRPRGPSRRPRLRSGWNAGPRRARRAASRRRSIRSARSASTGAPGCA